MDFPSFYHFWKKWDSKESKNNSNISASKAMHKSTRRHLRKVSSWTGYKGFSSADIKILMYILQDITFVYNVSFLYMTYMSPNQWQPLNSSHLRFLFFFLLMEKLLIKLQSFFSLICYHCYLSTLWRVANTFCVSEQTEQVTWKLWMQVNCWNSRRELGLSRL